MTIEDLKNIVFKKLKLGKAADIHRLTVEHLRYAGEDTLDHVLHVVNDLLKNMTAVASPEVKVGSASFVYKGKNKPINHHKSYRRVTVGPFIGRIADEWMREQTIPIYSPLQNNNQYGFTEGVDYKMGILQRYECQQYSLDNKKTLFGLTVDGVSAFDVVERPILLWELYNTGEEGDMWQFTNASYKNTTCKVKLDGKLSRSFEEILGVGQGRVRSSDHYLRSGSDGDLY